VSWAERAGEAPAVGGQGGWCRRWVVPGSPAVVGAGVGVRPHRTRPAPPPVRVNPAGALMTPFKKEARSRPGPDPRSRSRSGDVEVTQVRGGWPGPWISGREIVHHRGGWSPCCVFRMAPAGGWSNRPAPLDDDGGGGARGGASLMVTGRADDRPAERLGPRLSSGAGPVVERFRRVPTGDGEGHDSAPARDLGDETASPFVRVAERCSRRALGQDGRRVVLVFRVRRRRRPVAPLRSCVNHQGCRRPRPGPPPGFVPQERTGWS